MKWLIALVLILSACGGGDDPTPEQATPTNSDSISLSEGDAILTPTPPVDDVAWRQPSTILSRETVHRIEQIGQIIPPNTASTIFSWSFAPNGTELATLNNGFIYAWDLISGELLLNNTRQNALYIHYSSDKDEIYTVKDNGEINVFLNGRLQTTLNGHPEFNQTYDYFADTGWLALGGNDGTVKVWDTLERLSMVTFQAHNAPIRGITFSPDGQYVAISNFIDNVVGIWDWQNREKITDLTSGNSVPRLMQFSADGETIAISSGNAVNIWHVADAEYRYTLDVGASGADQVLKYSTDGRYLLTGGSVRDMAVWNAATGELLALLPDVKGNTISAAFSPDGNFVLASVLGEGVTLWDVSQISGDTLPRAQLPVGADIVSVDFSPDGFLLLMFDAAGPVYVWGIP